MIRHISLTIAVLLAATLAFGQRYDYDDIYFNPKKDLRKQTAVATPAKTNTNKVEVEEQYPAEQRVVPAEKQQSPTDAGTAVVTTAASVSSMSYADRINAFHRVDENEAQRSDLDRRMSDPNYTTNVFVLSDGQYIVDVDGDNIKVTENYSYPVVDWTGIYWTYPRYYGPSYYGYNYYYSFWGWSWYASWGWYAPWYYSYYDPFYDPYWSPYYGGYYGYCNPYYHHHHHHYCDHHHHHHNDYYYHDNHNWNNNYVRREKENDRRLLNANSQPVNIASNRVSSQPGRSEVSAVSATDAGRRNPTTANVSDSRNPSSATGNGSRNPVSSNVSSSRRDLVNDAISQGRVSSQSTSKSETAVKSNGSAVSERRIDNTPLEARPSSSISSGRRAGSASTVAGDRVNTGRGQSTTSQSRRNDRQTTTLPARPSRNSSSYNGSGSGSSSRSSSTVRSSGSSSSSRSSSTVRSSGSRSTSRSSSTVRSSGSSSSRGGGYSGGGRSSSSSSSSSRRR